MRGLEFDSESWEQENEGQERPEEGQEAVGYSPEYYLRSEVWNDSMRRQAAHDYYRYSRNGHREVADGVPYNDIGRLHLHRENMWRNRRMPVETPKQETEKPAEAPMGNLLKEALEKQGLKTESIGQIQETIEQQEGKEIVPGTAEYYEKQMEDALKRGNKMAFDVARRNWAKAHR